MILTFDFEDEDFDFDADDIVILEELSNIIQVDKETLEEIQDTDEEEYINLIYDNIEEIKSCFEDEARTLFDDYKTEQNDPYGYRGINRNDIDGV